ADVDDSSSWIGSSLIEWSSIVSRRETRRQLLLLKLDGLALASTLVRVQPLLLVKLDGLD
ncbi:MAG: hypothetical protein ACPHDJ_09165, partial [Candidatus Puniceispirillaceae bacterium]